MQHSPSDELPGARATEALAVVAHPDDESFGLGAVLAALAARGVVTRLLCFTHGEASTLGSAEDLARIRGGELRRAAAVLGISQVVLLDYPDGTLTEVPRVALDDEVGRQLGHADLLVVFGAGGVTGHPDHRAATAAAERVAVRHDLPVLEWGVPPDVARALNGELATAFVGGEGVDVRVDRTAQREAIRCHHSQAQDNPVLERRLALQGRRERLHLVECSAAGEARVSRSSKGPSALPPGP